MTPASIREVRAHWIRCPIPADQQHVSDFGLIETFDATIVSVTTDDGLTGYGEAKAAAGSAGSCATLVDCIANDVAPEVTGRDSRRITEIFETLYNGTRAGFALTRGRGFPGLGRRGLSIAALGALDTALWDLQGKRLGVPVVELLGGAVRDRLPCYASGGWADGDGIGAQLDQYVSQGFGAVKMRVGVMDGRVERSVDRVRTARRYLGPDIDIMVDAHGTFSVPEAKRFARDVEECGLRWFEEPVSSDDLPGLAEVRTFTSIPIAMGESEFTRFAFRDILARGAADVLQPDAAIIGGITEMQRVAHLASAHQVELAPHLWGSAISFMAGLHVAFASPSAAILEYSLGANPLLHELVEEEIAPEEGELLAPIVPGLGVTPKRDFIEEYTVTR